MTDWRLRATGSEEDDCLALHVTRAGQNKQELKKCLCCLIKLYDKRVRKVEQFWHLETGTHSVSTSKYKHYLCGQAMHTGQKNICKPHTSGLSTFGKAKRSSRGITWSRALHALQGRRLKRDYPRPDVFLSKEKKKETCSPLRSSHILLLLVSVKQWGVGARLSAASHRLSLNVQDFRFRTWLPLKAVDTSSIMLQTFPSWLTDGNAALASVCSETDVMPVYAFLRGENIDFIFACDTCKTPSLKKI